MRTEGSWYAGSADAIRQNLYLLERSPSKYVCVISGEHIYRMDYAALLEFHAERDADVTVACLEAADLEGRTTRCQVAVDGDLRVSAFARSGVPFRIPDEVVTTLGSMEVYAFKKTVLIELLSRTDFVGHAHRDLGLDLIPTVLAGGGRVLTYRFGGEAGRVSCDRYWRTLDNLDDYYAANMDLLHYEPAIDLYQQDWPIRTYHAQHPPARTVPGKSSNEGIFVNSIVASGTVIAGGGVNHSILFPRVFVGDAATVEDCILLSGVSVGEGARLLNCIVDKDVRIPAGVSVGYDRVRDARTFTVTERGIVIVPKTCKFD
jgi:glucose-1-phosphate adenylyltransferase